ncbi:hypothetical protein CesoFtcFv8_025823 [Champsocephalus esox]|uniref:Uncharacterized protein n=1 Tax=Champsocephalus esox TaxID=159716 RepID=A0AAN8B138_9TELE|nr:hypothetical protein CesoFtcFv8_025823 [Champsocephalus esox]
MVAGGLWRYSGSSPLGSSPEEGGLPQSSPCFTPSNSTLQTQTKARDCGPQAPGRLLIPFQLDNNLSGRWPPRGCKPPVRGLEEKSDSSSRMRT